MLVVCEITNATKNSNANKTANPSNAVNDSNGEASIFFTLERTSLVLEFAETHYFSNNARISLI